MGDAISPDGMESRQPMHSPEHSINRQLTMGLGAIVVVVFILVVGILWAIRYSDGRDERIHDDYFPQLMYAEQARTGVTQQQAGLQGFIITGDDRFLEIFESGRMLYTEARDGLIEGPELNDDLAALQRRQFEIVNAWYEEVALPEITQLREGNPAGSDEVAIVEASRVRVSEFQEANTAYQNEIRDLIEREDVSTTDIRNLIALFAVIGGLGVVALTVVFSIRTIAAIRGPLAALGQVVGAVDSGETNTRVPTLAAVEFNQLGQGINRMLDSLARTGVETEVQRSRFETIVESANEGIVVIDPDGTVTDINPAAQRMFDTDAETAVGHDAADLGFFSDAEIRRGIDRFTGGGSQPIARKRGDRVLSAVVSALMTSDTGDERPGWVWVLRDVTELVRIDEMKSEFISIVSHELRTPLTAIKGFTDLILEGEAGEITDEQRQFLEIVQSNGDRLVALINDMLDISRIESGRITLDVQEVALPAAIERTLAALRPLTDEKRISVLRELDDEAVTVLADEARLQQILTNLVSNASKYTPEGGWITVRSESLDGQIAVSVSDTGMGIPPESLPQVFSKFYRVDRPAVRDVGGTGLGLAITKSLVEMHGGRVNIASRVGVGTTVRFTIPSGSGDGAIDVEGLRSTAGGSTLVLIATPDEEERITWEQAISEIPATPVHTRGVSVAAIVGEAEMHRPGVIVARVGAPEEGLPSLSELREELDGNPELGRSRLVAVVSREVKATNGAREIILSDSIRPDELAEAIRGLIPQAPAERIRHGRVLVADDDADIAAWVRRVLVNAGFEVTIVRDGLAAIVRTIEILPDAVILDVNMPKMGASEVLPQLRSNPGTRDIPVIVITGTVPDSRPYFLELGASDFLAKPFDGDLLVRRLVELGKQSRNG